MESMSIVLIVLFRFCDSIAVCIRIYFDNNIQIFPNYMTTTSTPFYDWKKQR